MRESASKNPALDGVRAVAISLVLLYHAGAPFMGFGWIGVDIFFVLSGFLITRLLLEEHAAGGSIRLPEFWMRRLLRILPIYYFYALLITVLVLSGVGATQPHGGWSVAAYLLSIWGYFNNLAPLGGIWEHQYLTGHLWTLSVEEQFYLAWPLLLTVALRLGRPLVACTLICLAMYAARYLHEGSLENYLLHTRGIGLALGCLAAIAVASYGGGLAAWLSGVRIALIGGLNLAALLVLAALLHLDALQPDAVVGALVPWLDLLFAAWIAAVWLNPGSAAVRWLAWRPLAYIGRISYGIYLYHMLAWFLTWEVLLENLDGWPRVAKYGVRLCVYGALSVGMAALSYYAVERRLLSLKERFRPPYRRGQAAQVALPTLARAKRHARAAEDPGLSSSQSATPAAASATRAQDHLQPIVASPRR
jgi:peptidoglycan/LPS O-acetylase OafA/YrhL